MWAVIIIIIKILLAVQKTVQAQIELLVIKERILWVETAFDPIASPPTHPEPRTRIQTTLSNRTESDESDGNIKYYLIQYSHVWLLSTWNAASVIQELNFKIYLILINFMYNVNDHT